MQRSERFMNCSMVTLRLRGLLPIVLLFGSAGIATTQTESSRPSRVNATNQVTSKEGASALYGVSRPIAGKSASHSVTLGAEIQRIEHQKTVQKGNQVPAAVILSHRSATRNAPIDFRFQSTNQRGRINNLGSGSGSVRSGAGLRISEKRH